MFTLEKNIMPMLLPTTVSDLIPPKENLEIILKEKFSSTVYFNATIYRNNEMKEICKFSSGAEPSDFKMSTEFTNFNFQSSL